MAAYKVINLDSPIESDYWVDIPVRDPATNKDAVDEQGRILVQRHVTRCIKNKELTSFNTAVETLNTLKEDYSTFKEEVSTKVNTHDSNILTNTNSITTLTDSVTNHDLQINALYTKINAIQGIDIDDFKYVTETNIKNIKENYLPLAGGNLTGNLTVQNKNVVRSVNGVNANEIGNVQLGITGKIEWFAFNTAPDGYLVCDGAQVSRTTYADLFKAIGTTFGSGDGSTTFTLPNLIDKFAQGSTTVGTVKSAGLPNITGSSRARLMTANTSSAPVSLGAFSFGAASTAGTSGGNSYKIAELIFNASNSNSIYGNSTTVQPPALTLLPCIKY